MAEKASDDRIRLLLVETIKMLCKNEIQYESDVVIDGLLALTVDKNQVTVIPIRETIQILKQPPKKTVQPKSEYMQARKRRRSSNSNSDVSEKYEKKPNSCERRKRRNSSTHSDSSENSESKQTMHDPKHEPADDVGSSSIFDEAEWTVSETPQEEDDKTMKPHVTAILKIEDEDPNDVIIIKEEVMSDEECNEIESMVTACNNSVTFNSSFDDHKRTRHVPVPGTSLSGRTRDDNRPADDKKSSSVPYRWDELSSVFSTVPMDPSAFASMEAFQKAYQWMEGSPSGQNSAGKGKQRTLYSTLQQCPNCSHLGGKYRKWFPPNYQQMQEAYHGSTLRMRLLRLRKRLIESEMCLSCVQKLRSTGATGADNTNGGESYADTSLVRL